VFERESNREKKCVCVCVCVCVYVFMDDVSKSVCVREERRECLCVCVRERKHACVRVIVGSSYNSVRV